jgi:hypothetical protein
VGCNGSSFSCESDFVQKFLLIWSHFVVICPLIVDPNPCRLVLLTLAWHHAMDALSFEIDQLFMLLGPELLVGFAHDVGAIIFPSIFWHERILSSL